MEQEEGFVIPGQMVKTDKRPGHGLYAEKGNVYSALVGNMKESTDKAFVEPGNSIVEVKRGDTIIGTIETVRDKAVVVKILKVVGKQRALPTGGFGIIRVMDIANGYTENAKDEFKIGDVIKAEVAEVLPNDTILTTKSPNLGVIEGYCSSCRGILKSEAGKLVCTVCSKVERRKVSRDYLLKEGE
ncbi:MAG: exosome complex RNA-binding protein Csl4 [Candidatus Altiarchaeota archaeon]|nr:exosome complex RNA-binding protein Csl4 [Candidatus Altiarchaeota archaeon]